MTNTLLKDRTDDGVAANDSNWLGKLTVKQNMHDSVIGALAERRKHWEQGAYMRSNDELYELLTRCYQVYETMCANSMFATGLRESLRDYMKANNINCNKNSHNLIKIVRCVFGTADARRVSTYSVALRAAAQAGIKAQGLKQFIKDKGGVQELRVAKQTALNAADKAAKAKEALTAATLAEVHSDVLLQQVDMSNVGELVVLIATQQADGVFALHAVTASTTAVNAALVAYYSSNKAGIVNASATAAITKTEDALRELVAAPAQ